MNYRQLGTKSPVISVMSSGLREDAWHWKSNDASLFSSEKLRSILCLGELAQSDDDWEALKRVQLELERRAAGLK